MWLIQIADIHNSNKHTLEKIDKISDEMVTSINHYIKPDDLVVFTICGDILNQGQEVGFKDTLYFLDLIKKYINSNNIEFVICPGNHDIVNNNGIKSFKDIDKFIFDVSLDSKVKFDRQSINIKTINNIDFIIINSSFHLDHTYGKIDLKELNEILRQSKCNEKIIILHHHLIPIREGETSTIVNSYEFFKTLENKNILAILHGHQHMKMDMVVGNNLTRIIGVGSILEKIETNFNNQFNLIQIEEGEIRKIIEFKYNMDEMGNGTLGKFIGIEQL